MINERYSIIYSSRTGNTKKLAEAIYNATGVRVRELPITPEKIAMGILEKEMEK